MKLLKNFIYKAALIYGAVLILSYLLIRIQLIVVSPILVIFSVLLFLAEIHTIFHFFGMIYSLWPRKYKTYPEINTNRNLKINFLICVCGEPAEIIKATIIAAKESVRQYDELIHPYTKPRVVVLNDGFGAKKANAQEIVHLCRDLGVEHISRHTSEGFKAGNINNSLHYLRSHDTHNSIFIIFDSDFEANPEFVVEVVKPLADDSVDFVQTPQRYKNEKTWVARAAAAHQIYFFDYICPAKAHDNALFLCGTNFAIRQSALDSVGGMDQKFITEDYSTSLNLHLIGKKGVLIRKPLALGIAPSTLKAYYNQQRRWAKGTFDASFFYFGKLLFGPLTIRQKFHYLLSATYYFIGLRDLILMLAPIPFLFFGASLIRANTLSFLTFIYGPLFIYNFILYLLLFREPMRSLVLDIISFPVFVQAFVGSLFKEKLAFIVTIKRYSKESVFRVYKVQLAVLLLLITGISVSVLNARSGNPLATYINYFWAGFNTFFLGLGLVLIIKENYVKGEISYSSHPAKASRGIRVSSKYLLIPALLGVFAALVYLTPGYKNILHPAKLYESLAPRDIVYSLQTPVKGAYYGYYIPESNKHPLKPNFTVIPGEKPSITMYYQDWGEQAGFDSKFVESVYAQNIIPVITWEPWNVKKAKGGTIISEEFTPKVIASGRYDDYITSWAKDAAAYRQPFFLRFAHEMNGNWYPWGSVNDNTADDYINMWRHVHDIFVANHATNAIWVWSPNNTDAYGDSDSVLSYYPGSDYVDWVGFSGFNWGESGFLTHWTAFRDIGAKVYQELETTNKPIMVAETSSVSTGGDKSQWFKDTLRNDIPTFPKIKAVVFFHDDYGNANFSLLKGMTTYKTFKENIVDNEYYLKQPLLIDKSQSK